MSLESEPSGTKNLVPKIMGGVFVLIVAPIVTGIGVNLIQRKIDEAAAKKEADEKKENDAKTPDRAPSQSPPALASKTDAPGPVPKVAGIGPRRTPGAIQLFNGKDLSGFQTYLGPRHGEKKPLGLDNDPDHVFSVRHRVVRATGESFGVIRVSGQVGGAIETVDEYENYRLRVEYQWGEERWPPRDKPGELRISGIGFHFTGTRSNPLHIWRPSYRCRITDLEGAGDLGLSPLPREPLSLVAAVESSEPPLKAGHAPFQYLPGGKPTKIVGQHLILHAEPTEAPSAAPAATAPRWHELELICHGDRVTVIDGGRKVIEASQLSHTRGKIQLVSDYAEIFFRTVELIPLRKQRGSASK